MTATHVINLEAAPYCPYSWPVEEHVSGDCDFEWDTTKVALYLDQGQKYGRVIMGTELREKLKGRPVMNANLMDYLLAHQELIPDDWKGKGICFWGTIYRAPNGDFGLRYIYWDGLGWAWVYRWFANGFDSNSPTLVSVS